MGRLKIQQSLGVRVRLQPKIRDIYDDNVQYTMKNENLTCFFLVNIIFCKKTKPYQAVWLGLDLTSQAGLFRPELGLAWPNKARQSKPA